MDTPDSTALTAAGPAAAVIVGAIVRAFMESRRRAVKAAPIEDVLASVRLLDDALDRVRADIGALGQMVTNQSTMSLDIRADIAKLRADLGDLASATSGVRDAVRNVADGMTPIHEKPPFSPRRK